MAMRVGGKEFHIAKLIGAFIIMGAALMLLSSVFKLMWIASIIGSVNSGGYQTVTLELAGVTITQALVYGDSGTQLGLLLVPIAWIMLWAAVLFFGMILYQGCCCGGHMMAMPKEKRRR